MIRRPPRSTPLSLHDALPILPREPAHPLHPEPDDRGTRPLRELHRGRHARRARPPRSEEHTSELQSRQYLVCRLLLEKKNIFPPFPLFFLLLFSAPHFCFY